MSQPIEIPNRATGPKSAEGKFRASQNSLKHGLTAKSILIPGEDPADWQQHLDSYLDQFLPATAPERDLVFRIAAAQWRIRRAIEIEAQILAGRMEYEETNSKQTLTPGRLAATAYRRLSDEYRSLNNLNLQECRLSREYDRALRQLNQLQERRRALSLILPLPSDPIQPPAGSPSSDAGEIPHPCPQNTSAKNEASTPMAPAPLQVPSHIAPALEPDGRSTAKGGAPKPGMPIAHRPCDMLG
jgi:hypothetical protein